MNGSFRVRGEWFNCSEALALLALRAAETGELECRACVAAEIERHRLETSDPRESDRELKAWRVRHGRANDVETAHLIEMWRRWPELMREVDPETVKMLEQPRQRGQAS